MPVIVKTNLNLRSIPANVKKNFSRDLKSEIEEEIIAEIVSGNSPVAKKGRFKRYSKKYAERKKVAQSAVDMVLTGKMLDSLRVKQNRAGQLLIEFKSRIAAIHDRLGAGKSKVIRRLLPSRSGEEFNRNISRVIFDVLKRAVKKSIR